VVRVAKNALRAERTMHDAVSVRVSDSVGNLSRKAQPDIECERRTALANEVVESDFAGLATEKDGRAELVLVKIKSAKDAGMIERFEYLEFLKRGAADGLMGRLIPSRDGVKTNAAGRFSGRVLRLKVLVSEKRVFFDQFL
jgi:hypothetical protein